MRELRKGDRFLHKRLLEVDYRTPAECWVSRVALGTVYYHTFEGERGSPNCFPQEQRERWVKEILP